MLENLFVLKSITLFTIAAACNGSTWWAYMFAQTNGATSLTDLIQLGGTGGLVVALLGAIYALWRDRDTARKQFDAEIAGLRQLLVKERSDHREEVIAMRVQHKLDLDQVTNRYLEELRQQIETLRNETNAKLQVARTRTEHLADRVESAGE